MFDDDDDVVVAVVEVGDLLLLLAWLLLISMSLLLLMMMLLFPMLLSHVVLRKVCLTMGCNEVCVRIYEMKFSMCFFAFRLTRRNVLCVFGSHPGELFPPRGNHQTPGWRVSDEGVYA